MGRAVMAPKRQRRPAAAPGRLPRQVALRRPGLKETTALEDYEAGKEVDPKKVPLEGWKEGQQIVVTEAVYWEERIKAAGVIRALVVEGGLQLLRLDLQGSPAEALVKWRGAHPGKHLEVHLCPADCVDLSRDGLIHAKRIRKGTPEAREAWEDNLLEVMPVAQDELANLRRRAAQEGLAVGPPPPGGEREVSPSVTKEKKKKKKKKKEKTKVTGTKPLAQIFGGTGLDPQSGVRRELKRRARKVATKKMSGAKSSSSTSSSSASESSQTQDDRARLFGEEVKVKKVWKGYPGVLTLNTTEMMQESIVNQSGQPWDIETGVLPPIFSQYWRMVLAPKMSGPLGRESQTLCFAQDLLLQGKVAAASDVMTQRLKSLEQIATGAHYTNAQRQELVPLDFTSMTSPAEAMEATRVQREEVKSRTAAASSAWPRRTEWEKKDENKGKGKGKDSKGKNKQRWDGGKNQKEEDRGKREK